MPFAQTKLKALATAETRHKAALLFTPHSFLSLEDISAQKMRDLLTLATDMKKHPQAYNELLSGKHVALLFEKTSTRTRCSFETGIHELGGFCSVIDWKSSNFTLADLQDEAKCLSRYYDLIMARVYKHETLQTMATHSEVPVINGLCNLHHPCQALADYLTMTEYFSPNLAGINLTYIGDGNNVCRSLVHGAAHLGVNITLCSPKGYELADEGDLVAHIPDPIDAVAKADVIYTDTWVSMGDEAEEETRLKAFAGYQLNDDVLAAAPLHALVMHCLPAHPGQEISAEVLRGPRSIVLDQAENRKHAQKALMAWLIKE